MDRWEADWDHHLLARIGALLFALADLADLAAGAPHRRRRQAIAFLSHGEAEARAFVIGLATGVPMQPDGLPYGLADALDAPGEAAHLAASLRALALALCVLMARRSALPRAEQRYACRASRATTMRAFRWAVDPTWPALDTS